jgi:hypothetical protein
MVYIQCLVLSTTEVSRSSGMFVPPDDITPFGILDLRLQITPLVSSNISCIICLQDLNTKLVGKK